MFKQLFKVTEKSRRHYWAAIVAGVAGGMVSGFVKTGTEGIFPPRTPDRAIPPAEVLQTFGINVNDMVYQYSDHIVNWGISGVHYLFSVVFTLFYCLVAEILPGIKLWQGLAFGIVVTIGFHGVVMPLGGWAPPIWDLPRDELFSETVGHLLWAWTIEICRRDIRNRMTKLPDPEYA